jgi:hypothetical protein
VDQRVDNRSAGRCSGHAIEIEGGNSARFWPTAATFSLSLTAALAVVVLVIDGVGRLER